MRFSIIVLGILVLLACKSKDHEHYIPTKTEGMPEGIYQKYKGKLDTAYMNIDYFEIGVQLSNLHAPSGIIFSQISKGIESIPDNCLKIYEWYKFFADHNFQTNLVKSDTLKFIQCYVQCQDILGQNAYIEFQTNKELAYQERLATRELLDSTLFDVDLINSLEKIHTDDQFYRRKIYRKGISESEKKALFEKQKALDAVNLSKVKEILKNEYPSRKKVGYGCVAVV